MILSNLQPFVQGWHTSKWFIGWLATTPDRKARTSHGESGGFFAKSKGQPHTDKAKWHISFFVMEKVPRNLKSLHQEMVVLKWLAVRSRNFGAGWSFVNSLLEFLSELRVRPFTLPQPKTLWKKLVWSFQTSEMLQTHPGVQIFKTTEQRKKPGCLDNYVGIIINNCKETCTAFFLVTCIMKECSFFRFTQWGSGCS